MTSRDRLLIGLHSAGRAGHIVSPINGAPAVYSEAHTMTMRPSSDTEALPSTVRSRSHEARPHNDATAA